MPNYKKNATADVPDIRDRIYEAPLIQLQDVVEVPDDLYILDQKSEGACTGFSVAACINQLYKYADQDIRVSPRMLYEMAKRNDEWPGEDYDGSSLRGAIKGWKNMGVCKEEMWPYRTGDKGELTIDRAKDAREHTIGAYYRVRPEVTDFHAAINEAGIIAVSAKVHSGWDNPKNGIIKHQKKTEGGHAFALVGYNENGFLVQNSWGKKWGGYQQAGVALWTYEDWIANVMDAWVFRLALPTPQIFDAHPESSRIAVIDTGKVEKTSIHVDDGSYKETGRYWSTANDIDQTAKHFASSKKYKHLLVYVHGGLNTPKDSANRIFAMKEVFKSNEIYPFHIMYDTGIVEELKDLIWQKNKQAVDRVGGFADWTDRFLEGLLRRPGTLLWDEMKQDAKDAFAGAGAGTDALNRFTGYLRSSRRNVKLHLVGHSTGAVVIAHLLQTLRRRNIRFSTCSLLAPACSVDLYDQAYLPVLKRNYPIRINDMTIYNLKDKVELDDNVAKLYRKSLLYLVSNAFEKAKEKPILGMEKFKDMVTLARSQPEIIYSNGVDGVRTRSSTHGGFDNDPYTMNHILKRVLGKSPGRPFKDDDLSY
jgi:hypothetical protein